MSKDLRCPYCGYVFDSSWFETYPDQGIVSDADCPDCEKTFSYEVEYHPYFRSWKAPCLNGGEHDWQEIVGVPIFWFKNRRRCSVCDAEKMLQEVA